MRNFAYVLIVLLAAAGCRAATASGPRGELTAREAPPAPLVPDFEHKAGHVWVHGRWARVNDEWVWQAGHHERERDGLVYRNGTWERVNGQWTWIAGAWIAPRPGHIYVPGHFDVRRDTFVWIRDRWEPARAGVWVPGRWADENGERRWTDAHWAGATPVQVTGDVRRCRHTWCNLPVRRPLPTAHASR
jgi:hypothetical protein